ncbi:MAG: hypothetical protein KC729_05830, partial [Candidatus Eisenbacteria bacterium]|nr:hypothetical protein [Candidatus Eisenbacteria bacterium]
HPGLVAVADTPYCRVAVTSMADQVTVYTDNALAYETEGHEAAGLVHTTALQVDAPRRILVLGGGAAGLVREALKHHPEEVTYVDVDRRLLELVIPRLPDDDQASLRSGTVQIVIADPRRFLDRAGRYDVILLGMPEPSSGQAGRYYSREFFRQCAAHLAPGGALGFRMRSSENLWNQVQAMRAASVFHALESAFPDVLVLPASESVFLASNAPLRRDPAVSIERLECRGIESPLVTAPFLRYLYTNDRGPQIARRIAELPAIVHTDGRPIGYQLSQILWLSQFFPSLGTASPALSGLTQDRIAAGDQGGRRVRSNRAWRAFLAVLALMLAFAGSVVFRRRGLARRIVLVGSAATIAMVLESVLILRYQVHRGILFRDIGTLLTLTMIGLAAGAGGVDRLTASGSEASHRRSGPRTISLLTGGLAILAALVGVSAALPATHGLVATGIGLFLTGALVSAIFAQATRTQTEDPTRVIAPLYAADLCGGCIGSIAAAVVLIPDLGFGPTSWIMTVLALGSVILSLGSTGRALPAP